MASKYLPNFYLGIFPLCFPIRTFPPLMAESFHGRVFLFSLFFSSIFRVAEDLWRRAFSSLFSFLGDFSPYYFFPVSVQRLYMRQREPFSFLAFLTLKKNEVVGLPSPLLSHHLCFFFPFFNPHHLFLPITLCFSSCPLLSWFWHGSSKVVW